MSHLPSPRNNQLLFASGGLLCVGVSLYAFHAEVVDDYLISMRYASHLAAGHGLVWNPGERVEGFTNLLWTALLAVGLRAGAPPEILARVLGLLSLLGGLFLSWRLAGRFPDLAAGRRGLILFLLPACAPLAYWAGAGLEAPLFMLLWAGSRDSLARVWRGGGGWPLAALWLLLLPLCRPEGALFAGTALVAWALEPGPDGRRPWFKAAAAVSLAGAAYACWKLLYFGDLLPNTFHAKVHSPWALAGPGLGYAGRFILCCPWVLLAPLLALLPGRPPRDNGRSGAQDAAHKLTRLVAVDCLLLTLYIISVGGDEMPYFRFFVPLLPGLCLLGLLSLCRLDSLRPSRAGRSLTLAVVLLGLVSTAASLGGAEARKAVRSDRTTRIGQQVGRLLARALPPRTLVAVNAAGAIPYYSGLPALDMLGLNDRHIARAPAPPREDLALGHFRGDGRYVLSRAPGVVQFANTAGGLEPLYFSDHDLARQPGFRREYSPLTLRLEQPGKTRLLRTLILTGDALPHEKVDTRLGLLYRPVPAGIITLVEVYAVALDLHLYVRKDARKDLVRRLRRANSAK